MKIRNINAVWGAPVVFEAPTLGECKAAMAQAIRDSFAGLVADDLAEGTDYEVVTDASEAARALGRLGKGKHKTITEQDRERRREQARGLAAIRAAKRAAATETCLYCGAELPKPTTEREGNWWKIHDWDAERKLHAENCEWVRTRAHTQEGGNQ